MSKPRFGSKKFSRHGDYTQLESLPERKIVTFRDFRRGYTPSEQPQLTEPNASPNSHDVVITNDNRLSRAPGTSILEVFGQTIEEEGYDENSFIRNPSRLALHPSLNENIELVLFSPPEIGFRNESFTSWYDLNLANRDEFASTTFGGTFVFTDGKRVWSRRTTGSTPKIIDGAPVARSYASFASRVFAAACIIEGRFEPLGVRWIAANSNYKDWTGIGSGFELLVNDISIGDKIQSLIPMSLETIAAVMRNSIWLGRFTGQFNRPAAFSVSAPKVGAINRRVAKLSRYGIITLHNSGVYIFDGATPTMISKDINGELLPIDFDNIHLYHATFDPGQARYILFTPTNCWIYELEHNRWLKREFTSIDATIFPSQIDQTRWFELLGNWNDQSEFIWLDYAGEIIGDLSLQMLGNQISLDSDYDEDTVRVLVKEDFDSHAYFGVPFSGYWETPKIDEQDASMLVTITKQILEYSGSGIVRFHIPNVRGNYEPVSELSLLPSSDKSVIVMTNEKVSRGTGVGVEFIPTSAGVVLGNLR